MTRILFFFFTFSLAFAEARSLKAPVFLRIHGKDPTVKPSDIMNKMQVVFLDPLDGGKPFALRSSMMMVQGPQNEFTFNMILEPLNETTTQEYSRYISSLETMNVLGNVVHFETIQVIKHLAHVEIGNYDGALDDPFVITYQNPQAYSWTSLRQWETFSNEFGFALLDESHSRFKEFLLSFTEESGQTQVISDTLKVSNMMAIRSEVDIVLESGEVIRQDSAATPFLPFRFFRNCYQSNFENGFCF